MTLGSIRSLCLFAAVLASLPLAGCTRGRTEDVATISGKVTYQGEPVPAGSRLVLEDRSRGIRMSFEVDQSGGYTVNDITELPAGTYKVAVLPPAEPGVTDAEYDDVMNNPENPNASSGRPAADDFPVPEQQRDPEKSGQTVEVAPGSQTLDIDLK